MSLTLRRLVLVVLSIAAGVAGVVGVIALLNIIFPTAYVTYERYGTVYAVTTAVPIGLLAAVWLDYFLQTGILPDGMRTGTEGTESGAADQ